MAKLTLGQFFTVRQKNPDTPEDPYDPSRESPLELNLPANPELSVPAPLPPPPAVTLSTPAALPGVPEVMVSSPSALPEPPPVNLSSPEVLPPPPPVALSSPAVLPPPPPVQLTPPSALPPPPPVTPSVPSILPPPPPVTLSQPSALPPPPAVTLSSPGALPPAPAVTTSTPAVLPPPPPVNMVNSHPPADPNVVDVDTTLHSPAGLNPTPPEPNNGYLFAREVYSPLGSPAQGNLAADPVMYERQLERTARLPLDKMAVHVMTQTTLFAQNRVGNVWNPVLAAPPPIVQDFIRPALDLPSDGKTEITQVQIGSLVDEALSGQTKELVPAKSSPTGHGLLSSLADARLVNAFNNVKTSLANGNDFTALTSKIKRDPLIESAFSNGIIPMKFKNDNKFGFITHRKGEDVRTKITDDEAYVPLSFTDLRPIGNTFRTVYFRPIITGLSENISPEWNKSSYIGRVDPVATYQSTNRSISLSFKLVAFGPEDVRTIYQKLNWLVSMVYPEYDANLVYKSGPVVRMRVGDVISAAGVDGNRGLPGIIDSLDFDYSDTLWELKKDFKLPRNIDVSLSFTVLHETPIGRGLEGKFGGLGSIDADKGTFSVPTRKDSTGEEAAQVFNRFRTFGGESKPLSYKTLSTADKE